MSEARTLGLWLRRFLDEHVVIERNLSQNTVRSYRDAFMLLLPFVSAKARKSPDRLAVEDLSSERVRQFLAHLEEDRGCSAQTRNQRLTAVRSFARFVASRDPALVEWSGSIRSIALKKATPKPIEWLGQPEMDALIAVPDRRTQRGRTEHALLLFLYNSGARVSEAANLVVGDIEFRRPKDSHTIVTVHGKGGKIRKCPLWPRTERALSKLVKGRANNDAVFVSRLRKPYTRSGIYRLVERCAACVSALETQKVTPHVIRHTSACHLLKAGVDLNTIRAWLGHVSLDTTNVYAEIDLETKARAMALCDIAEDGSERPWKEDKGVMAFLRAH